MNKGPFRSKMHKKNMFNASNYHLFSKKVLYLHRINGRRIQRQESVQGTTLFCNLTNRCGDAYNLCIYIRKDNMAR